MFYNLGPSIPTNDRIPVNRRTRNHLSPIDLVLPNRLTRNHHSLAFQTTLAGTDITKSSFFPNTVRDRNFLADFLIPVTECEKIQLLS